MTGKGQVQNKIIKMFRWWWLWVPIPVKLSRDGNVFTIKVEMPVQYVLRVADYISGVVLSSMGKVEAEIKPKAEPEPEPDVAHTD